MNFRNGPTDCDGLAWETDVEDTYDKITSYKCKNKINDMVTCGNVSTELGDSCPACGARRWKTKNTKSERTQ